MVDSYSIHDLVTLRTNVDLPVPSYFETSVSEPDIEILQADIDADVPRSQKKKRKDYAVWRTEAGLVIDYEVLDLKLIIENLNGKTRVLFTERYGDQSMNHVNTLAKILIQLKLLERDYTFVHAGCVTFGDQAVLIPALGSTGKTYTTLSLVDGKECLFMSDDLAIVGRDGDVYSYPGSVGTGPYILENENVPEFNVKPALSAKLANIPLISLIFGKFPWIYKSKDLTPPARIVADGAKIGGVFLITGGDEDTITPLSSNQAIRMSLVQHLDTHGLFENYALNYYSYVFDYDLSARIETMRDILMDAFDDVDCYEMRSNSLDVYPKLIDSHFD